MEKLSRVFEFIGANEALFSGLAAIIAIIGVCLAIVIRLGGALRNKNTTSHTAADTSASNLQQDIQYVRTPDGVNIAWSAIGEGPTLVRSLGWFTNLELEWGDPRSRACVETVARNYRYVRYDARGIGMSQRDVESVSAATRLQDLEAVMDAANVEQCILMGLSEGGTTAISYAAKYPERVSHLILWGSFLKLKMDTAFMQRWSALLKLLPEQWGSDNHAFHQLLTSMFIPDGDAEQNRFFNEMQRESASAEIAMQTTLSVSEVDVTEQARSLQVPTLVMHRTDDLVIPCDQGREIAATIPGARLVQKKGANHWVHAEIGAFEEMVQEIDSFITSG